MAVLSRLRLSLGRLRSGGGLGARLAGGRGRSTELDDFRAYVAGDDPRLVDWPAAARLGQLFVKLFAAERELRVHILLDASESMAFGEGRRKWRLARELAAAVAFVALGSNDSVALACLGEGRARGARPGRGRAAYRRFDRFLASVEPAGRADLVGAARESARRQPGSGRVFVLVSDLLGEPRWRDALDSLSSACHALALLHVLDASDKSPAGVVGGETQFVDAETGERFVSAVTPRLVAQHRAAVERFERDVRDHCRRRGVAHQVVDPAAETRAERIVTRLFV